MIDDGTFQVLILFLAVLGVIVVGGFVVLLGGGGGKRERIRRESAPIHRRDAADDGRG